MSKRCDDSVSYEESRGGKNYFAIKKVYDAEAAGIRMLREAGIDESVLRLKSIEALKDVADGNATKIFMPADISNIVSTAGIVGETLGIGKAAAEKPKAEAPAPEDPCCDEEEDNN